MLQQFAAAVGVPSIAPPDLRRTCAKLCRAAGGELEQIQLLLGHASVQTTERYLGTKQDLIHAAERRNQTEDRLTVLASGTRLGAPLCLRRIKLPYTIKL
jgi:integrase